MKKKDSERGYNICLQSFLNIILCSIVKDSLPYHIKLDNHVIKKVGIFLHNDL